MLYLRKIKTTLTLSSAHSHWCWIGNYCAKPLIEIWWYLSSRKNRNCSDTVELNLFQRNVLNVSHTQCFSYSPILNDYRRNSSQAKTFFTYLCSPSLVSVFHLLNQGATEVFDISSAALETWSLLHCRWWNHRKDTWSTPEPCSDLSWDLHDQAEMGDKLRFTGNLKTQLVSPSFSCWKHGSPGTPNLWTPEHWGSEVC